MVCVGMKFKAGDQAFIVESNRIIREVQVRSCTGGMYLIKFPDTGGGIKVKEHAYLPRRKMLRRALEVMAESNARRHHMITCEPIYGR